MNGKNTFNFIDEQLAIAAQEKDISNPLKLIDVCELYPQYHQSATVTNEEGKSSKKDKKTHSNIYHQSQLNRLTKVLELYNAAVMMIVKRQLPDKLSFATKPINHIKWISSFYPMFLYGCDSTSHINYRYNLRNTIEMFRFMYKFQHPSSRNQLFTTIIGELHNLLQDLVQVWIYLHQERGMHQERNRMTSEPTPAIFIDLFPITTRRLLDDVSSRGVNKLRIVNIASCVRYINATLSILYALASNFVHDEAIVPLIQGNAMEGGFLNRDITLYETLITLVRMGHNSTKSQALQYLGELVRINGSFFSLEASQSFVQNLIGQQCLECVLLDGIESGNWPNYRTESIDDRVARLWKYLECGVFIGDPSQLIRCTIWNLSNSSSLALCSLLVNIFEKGLRAQGEQKRLLRDPKSPDLVHIIFSRGLMTKDLLVELIRLSCETLAIDSPVQEPSRKKARLETDSNFNVLGLQVSALDDLIKPIVGRIEKYLLGLLDPASEPHHNRFQRTGQWRSYDISMFVDTIMALIWDNNGNETQDPGGSTPIIHVRHCQVMNNIVQHLITLVSNNATLMDVVDIIRAYTGRKTTPHSNAVDLVIAGEICQTTWHLDLVKHIMRILFEDFACCVPQNYSDETLRYQLRQSCLEFLLDCMTWDITNEQSIACGHWLIDKALQHHDQKAKLIHMQQLPHLLSVIACESSDTRVRKLQDAARNIIVEVKSILSSIPAATTDDTLTQTLQTIADILGPVCEYCLSSLTSEDIRKFISTCFEHLFSEKNSAGVKIAFLKSFPKVFLAVTRLEKTSKGMSTIIWSDLKKYAIAVLETIVKSSSDEIRQFIISSSMFEDLMSAVPEVGIGFGHFVTVIYKHGVGDLLYHLHKGLNISLGARDSKSAEIRLCIICKVGLASTKIEIQKQSLFIMAHALYCPELNIMTTAIYYITALLAHNGSKTALSILPIGDTLFDKWVILLLNNPSLIHKKRYLHEEAFKIVASVLYDTTALKLLEPIAPRLVPQLVEGKMYESIRLLGQAMGSEYANGLWKFYFVDILAFLMKKRLLVQESDAENYLGELGDWKLELKAQATQLLTELSLRLEHEKEEEATLQVLKSGFEFVALQNGSRYEDLKSGIFLAIIETLSEEVLKQHSTYAGRDPLSTTRGISRFRSILKFMNSTCTSFTSNITSLLKNVLDVYSGAIEFGDVLKEIMMTWEVFVRVLDSEKLGDIFPQIVVHLLPYLEREEKAVNVIKFMVVDKRDSLEPYFDQLPSLPNISSLKDIRTIIPEDETMYGNAPNARHLVLERKIRRSLNCIKYDSIDVQRVGLKQLKQVIEKYHDTIWEWIEKADSIFNQNRSDAFESEPRKKKGKIRKGVSYIGLINELVSTLMEKCANAPKEDRNKYLECLGILGAIDPCRLSVDHFGYDNRVELGDIELACTLIDNFLYKHLKSADKTKQKTASFVIQELLKVCKIRSIGGSASLNYESVDFTQFPWFNRFGTKQEELRPLTQSCYQSVSSSASKKSVERPIFRPSISHNVWLARLCKFLMDRSIGSRRDLFLSFRPAFSHFQDAAKFLLPYMVHNVLLHGKDIDRNDIREEFMSILEQVASEDSQSKSDNDQLNQNVVVKHTHEHIQTVFSVLDLLRTWLRNVNFSPTKKQEVDIIQRFAHIEKLVNSIPNDLMARAAFNNKAYARSLMYYENYLRMTLEQFRTKNKIATYGFPVHTVDRIVLLNSYSSETGVEPLPFLQHIYCHLDDPDALQGIATLRTNTSLQEQIIDHEANGDWNEALICYELALQEEPDNIGYHLNMLMCNRMEGHLQTMLRSIDGALARLQTNNMQLKTYAVQSAWRLGEWELVGEYLNGADCMDFEVNLAKALYAYNMKDANSFQNAITDMMNLITSPFAAASSESYERAYPLIVRSQMIVELVQSFNVFCNNSDTIKSHRELLSHQWNNKLKLTVDSLESREPLISLRRILYSMNGMEREVGFSWLTYTKLARKRKNFSQAKSAILQAKNYVEFLPEYALNAAKLLYAEGNANQALLTIEAKSNFDKVAKFSQQSENDEVAARRLKAKMKLLAVNWNEALRKKKSNDLKENYEEIVRLEPNWEEGYFNLAKYIDSLFTSRINNKVGFVIPTPTAAPTTSRSRRSSKRIDLSPRDLAIEQAYVKLVPDLILNYGYTLQYGIKHIYHALPRLLTVLCNTGDLVLEKKSSLKDELNEQIISIAQNLLYALHPSIWMVALSQIISRFDHKNDETKTLIHSIIKKLLVSYPKHSMWMLSRLLYSKNADVKNMFIKLFKEAQKDIAPDRNIILSNYQLFLQQIITFCNAKSNSNEMLFSSVSSLKPIKKMLVNDTHVMLPLQDALSPELIHIPGYTNRMVDVGDHIVTYADGTVDIAGFEERIKVMSSVAKPKKMGIIGSDGKVYPFLAKPKDDLRKDSRFMEFSRVINRLFLRDPQTRKRRLYIRTFSAIPLTESAGLVEWVENTNVYRCTVEEAEEQGGSQNAPPFFKNRIEYCHRLKNAPPTLPNAVYDPEETFLKKHGFHSIDAARKKLPNRVEVFKDIISIVPRIFHRWFLIKFPEPTKWFQSRLNYVRTCAVMSMVGWVMGLGDRHTENILMDQVTGDLLHIDLNMIFEEGLKLKVPEIVPFRLTTNMIDAMGICGYEGTFRSIGEATLQMLRENREMLLTVLDSFIHDPLMTISDQNAALETIDRKLKGMEIIHHNADAITHKKSTINPDEFSEDESRILSVQGQVDQLITHASDFERLAHMYPYWCPFV